MFIVSALCVSIAFPNTLEKIEKTSIELDSFSTPPPQNDYYDPITLNLQNSFTGDNNKNPLSPQNITVLENLDKYLTETADLYRNSQILTGDFVVHDVDWNASEIFTRLEKFSFLDDPYVDSTPENIETVQLSNDTKDILPLKRRPIETIAYNDQPNNHNSAHHETPVSFTEISCPNLNTQHNLIIRKLYDIDRAIKLIRHTPPSIKNTKTNKHDQILLKTFKISEKNQQSVYFHIKKGNIMINFENMGDLSLESFVKWLFGQKRLLKLVIPIETHLRQIIATKYSNLINIGDLNPTASNTVTG